MSDTFNFQLPVPLSFDQLKRLARGETIELAPAVEGYRIRVIIEGTPPFSHEIYEQAEARCVRPEDPEPRDY